MFGRRRCDRLCHPRVHIHVIHVLMAHVWFGRFGDAGFSLRAQVRTERGNEDIRALTKKQCDSEDACGY